MLPLANTIPTSVIPGRYTRQRRPLSRWQIIQIGDIEDAIAAQKHEYADGPGRYAYRTLPTIRTSVVIAEGQCVEIVIVRYPWRRLTQAERTALAATPEQAQVLAYPPRTETWIHAANGDQTDHYIDTDPADALAVFVTSLKGRG